MPDHGTSAVSVRNFCAYCRREIRVEPDDHADDCLRDFEAEMPLPDPDDFGLSTSAERNNT